MIRTGTSKLQIVAAITQAYPDPIGAEFSEAIPAGTEAAERQVRFNSLMLKAKETHAYYQKAFAHLRPKGPK